MPSDGRLRRFLHLERARPAGAGAPPPREREGDETRERIAGVERPGGAAGPAGAAPRRTRTGAQLERFGPEPEPALELVETEGRPAFIRCRRCGGDNNVFAVSCAGCGVSLDTPEQHEFDERFWRARQAEAEREQRIDEERLAQRVRDEVAEAEARRTAAEELAREAGDAERRRLGWMGAGRAGPWQPLGLRLVRRLVPDERWQPLALGAAAGVAAVTAGWGLHVGSGVLALAGLAALALLLVHAPE